MTDDLLHARDVSHRYHRDPVLIDVAVSFGSQRSVGIIGPNGSGKSTLLKILAGLVRPSRGRVELEGRDLADLGARQRARRIAWLGQQEGVVFAYRAIEVVLLGRFPHHSGIGLLGSSDLEIAREAMESTETWALRDRFVTDLSGGELARVQLARILTQQAGILLLDEPTSSLDLRHQILAMTTLLQQSKGLLVTVFHELNLAARFCDRIVLLDRGRIAADGPPREVIDPAVLEPVYGTRVATGTVPEDDSLFVVPIV